MAGPAYYTGVMNISKNEDWVVSFLYQQLGSDGVTLTPIDLTGSTIKSEIRINETDHEAVVYSTSVGNDGVYIASDPTTGMFTLVFDRTNKLVRLSSGQTYTCDIVRLMPSGYQERLWEGLAYVVEGTTR
jgi:hypothetical protein